MNEGSSRYLDQLVVTKILREKLTRVRHPPPRDLSCREAAPFADLEGIRAPRPHVVSRCERGGERWTFESPVHSPYVENRRAVLHRHGVRGAVGNVLFLHGLFDDSRAMYGFLTSILNERRLDVYQLVLPFHYERKPPESLFGGEYFWSANLARCATALKQAIYDLIVAYRMIEARTGLPTLPVGFSMGGGVTLRALSLCPEMQRALVINPVPLIARLAWDNPLCRTIREELERHGWDLGRVSEVFRPFEPLGHPDTATVGKRLVLARGLYDEIIATADYDALCERLAPAKVHAYRAGHISILRVPRLAMDVAQAMPGARV